MATYALVQNGTVQSVFTSTKPTSAFPDIQKYLVDVTSNPSVQVGWLTTDNVNFTAPQVADTTDAVTATLQGLVAAGVITQSQMNLALSGS